MDARSAFKFGFMSRCIENGITDPLEMLEVVKQAGLGELGAGLGGILAAGEGAKMLGEGVKGLGELGGAALEWGVPAAIAAPPILGYIGGNLAAKATNVDEFDTDDAKQQELVDEYKRQTARLQRQHQLSGGYRPRSF